MIDRKQLLEIHNQTTKTAFEIMELKNRDYAGANPDALANFKRIEMLGVVTLEQGILVRLCDKFARIINLTQSTTRAVSDESIEDTIIDAINYLIILRAAVRDSAS
jgi:hypothetical protein